MFLGCPIGGARCGQGRRALLVETVDGFGLPTDLISSAIPIRARCPPHTRSRGGIMGEKRKREASSERIIWASVDKEPVRFFVGLSSQEFFTRHWEQEPAVFKADACRRQLFEALFTTPRFFDLVAERDAGACLTALLHSPFTSNKRFQRCACVLGSFLFLLLTAAERGASANSLCTARRVCFALYAPILLARYAAYVCFAAA